ncbi:sensor domain-containing protein [Lysinibacillus fusiformis]|uniref:Diguanylate cyclase/phosphodiesterase n=1 Tax=Lysinibacillus fusiformis TaxID=28031 RepID=A0A1H9LSQ5_9BACI|nr:EAL domain-containing protein [Lysinibacillus fusiformis]SCY57046.1 diguanylate cyclase/phosphodiesterase [Lysinibacillus fusiformis]SEO27311.1 diguanylate cyclase/phosphodiesterase [Lysinibacillus fusiformis]SER14225.1 diguanylate cyclase/phosphodiesterase [Lysinibacillus fusiformis]
MVTKSLDVDNDVLLNSILKLGDNSKESYVIFDATNHHIIVECNEFFCNLTNASRSQILKTNYFAWLSDEKMTTIKMIKEKIHNGIMVQAKLHHKGINKPLFWAEIQALPFRNDTNITQYVLVLIKDVTYYHTEDFLMRLENDMYKAIERDSSFEQKMHIICHGLDEFFMPNTSSMVLIKTESNLLQAFTDNCRKKDVPRCCENNDFFTKVMQSETSIFIENLDEVYIPDEHKQFAASSHKPYGLFIPIRNQQRQVIGLFSIYYEQAHNDSSYFKSMFRKIGALVALAFTYARTQRKIWDLAYTDITTGLPNRHSFVNFLEKEVERGQNGYIKIVKPSEFHQVVELYGREFGDELLRQLAKRLEQDKPADREYIARFTSSSLILSTMTFDENLNNYEWRIKETIRQPFIIGGKQIYITLKTGIASFNDDIKINDAIRFADNALSFATDKPGTHTEIFTTEKNDVLVQRMTVLNHLSQAIKNKEITVHLQPKVDLRNGEIQSIEALARWISPKLGFVSPAIFIPVAESAGKVREIDVLVLETVLSWLAERQKLGKKLVKIAVNISPDHFYYTHFVQDTLKLVRQYGIDPSNIILEVTENIGLVDFQSAYKIIQELKSYGFKTSVDDFGTGFSSLSYLQQLPFTELKIDRSFINALEDPATLAIVRSIIQLALNLGMISVAEGIETEEQVEILRALGCTVGQGFFYFKPMAIEELDLILDQ